MKTIFIPHLYGRFGNNIIALMNAVHLCVKNNYAKIIYGFHYAHYNFFNKTEAIINDVNNNETDTLELHPDWIYFSRQHGDIEDFDNDRELFDKYVANLINIDLSSKKAELVLYMRGEDVFTKKCAKSIQPPLYFYKKVMEIENVDKPTMVSLDLLNPVANYMHYQNLVVWTQQDFDKDLTLLLNCEALAFGYSTLIYPILLLSKRLKRLYLPRSAYNYYITLKINISNLLKDDQELIIIDLPGFGDVVGEFQHSPEAYKKMIDYLP